MLTHPDIGNSTILKFMISLTKEISKQFNITDKLALQKIDNVRKKFLIVTI